MLQCSRPLPLEHLRKIQLLLKANRSEVPHPSHFIMSRVQRVRNEMSKIFFSSLSRGARYTGQLPQYMPQRPTRALSDMKGHYMARCINCFRDFSIFSCFVLGSFSFVVFATHVQPPGFLTTEASSSVFSWYSLILLSHLLLVLPSAFWFAPRCFCLPMVLWFCLRCFCLPAVFLTRRHKTFSDFTNTKP